MQINFGLTRGAFGPPRIGGVAYTGGALNHNVHVVSPMPMKTERGRLYHMVVSDDFVQRIDDWRRRQHDIPSRAEAIRRLVSRGLDAEEIQGKRKPER